MMMDNVIGAIGSPDFGKVLFAALHDDMAARQVVVHRFHEGAPVEPLIQESAETGDWVRTLVKRYVGGYFPHDPFRPMLEMPRQREICVLAVNAQEINHAEYREKLYVEPGLAGKMAVILRQPGEVISISLYRDRNDGAFTGRDVAKIGRCTQTLAAALEKHLSLMDNVVSPTVRNIEQALVHLDEERPLVAARGERLRAGGDGLYQRSCIARPRLVLPFGCDLSPARLRQVGYHVAKRIICTAAEPLASATHPQGAAADQLADGATRTAFVATLPPAQQGSWRREHVTSDVAALGAITRS